MARLNKFNLILITGVIMGMLVFGPVYANATEKGNGTSQTQNMDEKKKNDHGMEMPQDSGDMDMSQQKMKMDSGTVSEQKAVEGDHSDEKAGEDHGEVKQEEPIPWGSIYGFLIINAIIIIIAAIIKFTRGKKVEERRV